ncbi:MAG: TolC family protein [Candidatus Cloacimonetes bacterium]|nr:TolC family protein [Candidatus Cloacimonadota bacterium]MBT4333365.1 TolC family protein [Candidatus Cloacimonadota bacterium]
MRKYKIIALMFCCFAITFLQAEESLTLNEILQRVQENNLELKSMQKQIEAAKAGIDQARLNPNPELEIELGNFGKDEIGIGIGQSFELGGKKKSRIEIAKTVVEKSELELEMKKFELEIETIRRVLPLYSITTKLALLDFIIAIEKSTLETIQKRVEAGSTMPIDAMRAEIELEELYLEKRLTDREVIQLKKTLPSLWSDSTVDFVSVSGKIKSELIIPSIESFQKSLLDHPEIRMIELEQKLYRAELNEAKTDAIPDLNIGVGFSRSMEANENAIGLSASIDLPIFNRNQGEIKTGKYSIDAFEFDASNIILNKKAELEEIYAQVSTINEELITIQTKILPKAETVFQTLLEYYQRGSISLLDVIEAQTELLDYKTRVIENHLIRAELLTELYELTGLNVKIIVNEQKQEMELK